MRRLNRDEEGDSPRIRAIKKSMRDALDSLPAERVIYPPLNAQNGFAEAVDHRLKRRDAFLGCPRTGDLVSGDFGERDLRHEPLDLVSEVLFAHQTTLSLRLPFVK